MTRRTLPALSVLLATAAAVAQTDPGSTGALPPVGADTPSEAPSAAPSASAAPTSSAGPPAPTPLIPGPQPAHPGASAAAPPAPPPQQPGEHGAPPGYYGAPPGYYGYPPGSYPPPIPTEPPPPERHVTLTISPIHLFLPIFELTAEVRVVDAFSLAAIGGFGSISAETTLGETQRFDAYELGAQAVFYPMKPFQGLELGAEFLYVNVSGDNLDQQNVSGVGVGWALGPMVGYKVVADGGFTFVAQGGMQYVNLSAEASDGAGNSASESDSKWIPLLNLNIGWSF